MGENVGVVLWWKIPGEGVVEVSETKRMSIIGAPGGSWNISNMLFRFVTVKCDWCWKSSQNFVLCDPL